MTSKNRVSSTFLRSLADAIDALSEHELKALLTSAKLDTLLGPVLNSPRVKPVNDQALREQAYSVMSTLAEASSREEAREYLAIAKPSRRLLIKAAQLRDVHVVKEDTVAVLIEKLVANVVGSRLDSAAIRNGQR